MRRPPRSPLFPYPTLFRSEDRIDSELRRAVELVEAGAEVAERRLLDTHRARSRRQDRKSTRLNSSHRTISYAVFCLKKKNREERACGTRVSRDGDGRTP